MLESRRIEHYRHVAIAMMRACISIALAAVASALQPGSLRPPTRSRAAAIKLQLPEPPGFLKDLASKAATAAGDLGAKAFAEMEKQASIAAGQEQTPAEAAEADRIANIDLPPARPLPDSFDDAISIAVEATSECLADDNLRIVIEFDTSAGDETYNLQSRTLKFLQPFLVPFIDAACPDYPVETAAPMVEEMVDDDGNLVPAPAPEPTAAAAEDDDRPPRAQLLFPDEGTAAFVKKNWGGSLPPRVQLGSMPRAKLAVGTEVLMLCSPQATEVDAVQRLLAEVGEKSPTTLVLIINPQLVNMVSTGYGLVGRDLRDMVTNTFTVAFALKSYPEGACYRVYPGGWSIWRENSLAAGGYELTYSSSRRPVGEEVDEFLTDPNDVDGSGGSPLGNIGAFIKNFQAM